MEPLPHSHRRFGWGRVLGLIFLVLLLLILSGYWYWSHQAGRRLAAELAALRAAGEPVSTAELLPSPVPDERNAVLLLVQAAKSIDQQSDAWQQLRDLASPVEQVRLPLTEQERAVLQRAVEENADALPLIAQAVKREGIDWQVDYTQGMSLMLPDLGGQRALTTLLQSAALLAHERGDDAQALHYLDQLRFISHAVGEQPTLVSFLVSCGMERQRTAALALVAPELRISDTDERAISTARLQRLIDELLDEGPRREILLRGMRGERVFQQDTMHRLLRGDLGVSDVSAPKGPGEKTGGAILTPLLLGPVMKEDALIMLRHMNQMIAGATESRDWPAFGAQAPALPPAVLNRPWRHPFARMLLPALQRAVLVHYQTVNDRRLAATALAMRWYARDHDGALPGALEALAPRYLPAVPLDALAGENAPIRYLADPERPLLYHVGRNGKDDGGQEPDPSAPERADGASDAVVHLKRHARPIPRHDAE